MRLHNDTPANVIGQSLERQGQADNLAALEHASASTLSTIDTLHALGCLSVCERDAYAVAALAAENARRSTLPAADEAEDGDFSSCETGHAVGRVLALYAAGLLTAAECDAAARAAEEAEGHPVQGGAQ